MFLKRTHSLRQLSLAMTLFLGAALVACSSDTDRVEKYVEKANKSTPVNYGEQLFLTSVNIDGNHVVYNVEYRGKNDSLTLAIFNETRNEFAKLYVDRLDKETKELFSNAKYGVRVIVRDTTATRSVTMEVKPEDIK